MKTFLKLFIMIAMISFVYEGSSQIKINVKKKVENQTNNRANSKTDQAIDKGLDKIEGIFKKKDKTEQTQQNQQDQGNQQQGGNNNNENQPAGQDQPGLQSYSKYDFIPGEKVIFYEDFSQDAVGDFPALWNTNGSAEVVTTNLYPGNWMRFIMRECVWTDALLKLPDNYTIEYDVIPIAGEDNKSMAGWNMLLMQARNVKAWDHGSAPGQGGYWFSVEYYGRPSYGTWLYGSECEQLKTGGSKEGDQKYHIAIWVQKTRVRLYQDQNKLFDSPKAFPTDCVKPDRLRFEEGAAMVSNIRIAVGAPDMRNKLMTEGKLVTYGIYFDVNKDVVKPESYGTLKGIADILNEVPDVKVKIVGHTDSDGADAANLDLSKRR
jgi:outer membrane protein OmpA-like peptidoglycan-associated protein